MVTSTHTHNTKATHSSQIHRQLCQALVLVPKPSMPMRFPSCFHASLFFSLCVCSSFSNSCMVNRKIKRIPFEWEITPIDFTERSKSGRWKEEEAKKLNVYKNCGRILCREQCTPFPWLNSILLQYIYFSWFLFSGGFLLFGDIIRLFCIFHSILVYFFSMPLNSI